MKELNFVKVEDRKVGWPEYVALANIGLFSVSREKDTLLKTEFLWCRFTPAYETLGIVEHSGTFDEMELAKKWCNGVVAEYANIESALGESRRLTMKETQ